MWVPNFIGSFISIKWFKKLCSSPLWKKPYSIPTTTSRKMFNCYCVQIKIFLHQSPGGESHHSLTSLSRMWTIKLFSMEKKFHRISINPSLTSSIWFAISQKLINFSEFFHQSFDWYETSHEIRDPRLLWHGCGFWRRLLIS